MCLRQIEVTHPHRQSCRTANSYFLRIQCLFASHPIRGTARPTPLIRLIACQADPAVHHRPRLKDGTKSYRFGDVVLTETAQRHREHGLFRPLVSQRLKFSRLLVPSCARTTIVDPLSFTQEKARKDRWCLHTAVCTSVMSLVQRGTTSVRAMDTRAREWVTPTHRRWWRAR